MSVGFNAVSYVKIAILHHDKIELERRLKQYDVSFFHRDLFYTVIVSDFVSAVSCFASFINNALTPDMGYAVHLAKSREMIKELVRLGACLNVKTQGGFSPLHTARNIEVIEELLRCGMDVNVCDSKGRSPLNHYIQNYNCIAFIFSFVENCNPFISSFVNHWYSSSSVRVYFQQTLPQRHDHCLKVVLLLIGTKAFRYKDITLMIARLVWKTRRDPCWDFKKSKNKK